MKRCLNLDWLEIYCLEDLLSYPHDAEYFRSQGFQVLEREYGTRIYQQMFTLCDPDGKPMIEVRRLPFDVKKSGVKRVIDQLSCHVRLVNRWCYSKSPALLLSQFCEHYGLIYQRISRVDICLDFERFDYGDDPQKFVRRYINHRFAKINQAELSAHGKDWWDGVAWNWLSWGSPSSAVSTKLYNKTLELREVHFKPWIVQAWKEDELIDDFRAITRHDKKGNVYKPTIWRLEFCVKSSVRNWIEIETQHGEPNKRQSLRNDLNAYMQKENYISIFASLQHHYFYFVKYDANKSKYKCDEKRLFNWETEQTFTVMPEKPLTKPEANSLADMLLSRLILYREHTIEPAEIKACTTLIDMLQSKKIRGLLPNAANKKEQEMLKALLAIRQKETEKRPLSDDRAFISALFSLSEKLF